MAEPIVALATPPGVAALAVVRLSGDGAAAVVGRMLRRPVAWAHRRTWHRELYDGTTLLDEAVLAYWEAPRSYTGEETVEITCHGNPFLAQRVVAACLALGARAAGPGEFTQRAFLNGKIDLTQAEAVADLISAATDREIAGAQAMRAGKLGERMQALRAALIDLLAHVEAHIDFPEEGIDPATGETLAAGVREVRDGVERLLATAPLGRILRHGVATAIVGAPNAGKSSLFNALLREDRAIVSPTPGTTRDVIETECRIGSLRLRLLDTAGRRETGDAVEAEGVRRAAAAAAGAELVIHLLDGATPAAAQPPYVPEPGQKVLPLAGKADLGVHPDNVALGLLAVSPVTGAGLDTLPARIEALLLGSEGAGGEPLTVNTRQETALRAALAALGTAVDELARGVSPELSSLPLREALRAVGEVVGIATNEDVLDALFLKFCIGK